MGRLLWLRGEGICRLVVWLLVGWDGNGCTKVKYLGGLETNWGCCVYSLLS